ncbi:MAG: imidazole glycerol phosphate synthase subunit HisH [Oscillospiraceae bacterium]|jgi:glutamine amidotransferase
MTVIIDYGVGNLFSLQSSLKQLGEQTAVSGDERVIRSADRLILPGVGAFRDAREKLSKNGLDKVLCEESHKGKPLMGICLGMQLLFSRSFEFGETEGLGLIEGDVKPIAPLLPKELKVPHIGWNSLKLNGNPEIFKYVADGDFVYFVHSFAAMHCESSVIATADYGAELTAAVQNGNVLGMQFHPEKSGETGLRILKAFCEM